MAFHALRPGLEDYLGSSGDSRTAFKEHGLGGEDLPSLKIRLLPPARIGRRRTRQGAFVINTMTLITSHSHRNQHLGWLWNG